ncbi:hypothetical protein QYE76_010649 [Lolium multiflorum]|uniref:CCHC-type domain-containing protein n=1 Tax=Lolium multiflorum TaxID=4521 RepID=A0AAD8TVY9_LOLMU|nr:hypothetical protein QYE76_010649 [Lolium multiflorum]
MIQTSVGTQDLSLIRNFTTAKEAWEGLDSSFMGSESMKRNNYSALRNQAEGLMRLSDEDHQVMYRRLIIVSEAFRNVGAKHIDDFWIKDKYIDCMMPFEPIDVKTLVGRESYSSLTSQQVVHELQALKVLEQNSQDSCNRAIGMSRGTSLALMVNTVEDLEYHYNDHMAFNAKTFWVDPYKAKEDKIKRNNSSSFKSLGPKSRSCYNCGDKRHFIAECPYEHRETHGGRLIPKDKSKYSKAPNKKFYNKSKKGKRPSRIVLVTKEEYSSEDDDSSSDEEETSKELAAIATTNIPSSSLFESPNENPRIKNAHCFMTSKSYKGNILELDKINACGLIFPRSSKTGGYEEGPQARHTGRRGQRGPALPYGVGPSRRLLTYPSGYLKPSSRNPMYREPRYGKPSRDAAANPISGIQRSSAPAERGIITGGLYIIMPASGLMRE